MTTTSGQSHWVKQLYYYLVLAACILALSIATFTLARANLVKYVFPNIDNYYSGMKSQCDYIDPQMVKNETKEQCLERVERETAETKKLNYERDMLNSILTVIVTSLVLGLHIRLIKI